MAGIPISQVQQQLGHAIDATSINTKLANAAHQIVIEGPSYRAKLAPKHRVVDDQP